MGIFAGISREQSVRTFLLCMQNTEFMDAVAVLKKARFQSLPGAVPIPPPHALWRLGRWCLEQKRPKDASIPLQLFADLYPHHEDRGAALHDLALALNGMKRVQRAAEVAREALKLSKTGE
jgi:hypothetical protein